MQYTILVIGILICTSSPCVEAQKPRFGIKAGAAISNCTYNASNTPSSVSKNKVGLLLGVMVHVPLSKNIAFRPGLDFVQKGFRSATQAYSDNYTLNYFDIPLNLLFYDRLHRGKIIFGGGPVISFRAGDYLDTYPLATTRSDIGLNILAGYEFPIGFFINTNYTYGLKNVSADKTNSTIRNRYLGLNVGYLF
ncbi:MAG: porin family protein [Ferruginibacter sp.]